MNKMPPLSLIDNAIPKIPEIGHAPPPKGEGKLTALLGPTNTGKTHYAIERLLLHPTGLIGLPLRLLAREVYQRLIEKVGEKSVALITGEEKIKPKNARYTVSTVEAMPLDLNVSIVVIDEVQIAADLERGHIFTDRILNLRGKNETLLLGSDTIAPLLKSLLPNIEIISRPRLSTLQFSGEKKLTRLPPRTAIVAFSANDVYEIAELVRRQHGGAAVVLGSLSPRTRNSQVALYQNGEVDYLIATDAIGMGLNLDVAHVAFAGERKFDGFHYRKLFPAEFGQIAGRAGRYTTNGTFGTTGRCPAFEDDLVQALESHDFQSHKILQWRNRALDYTSLSSLAHSLDQYPTIQGLTRAPLADDQKVLEAAMTKPHIRALATNQDTIELLWNCCLLPDYRKVSPAAHIDLCLTLFEYLAKDRFIDDNWFAIHAKECDILSGDIDSLSYRLAKIRTYTYVASKKNWLKRVDYWQNETRRIEDSLSDALHERLTARFLDKRTSLLMRRLREKATMDIRIDKSGEVFVEEQMVGRLEGFQFTPDMSATGIDLKTLKVAASSVLALEISKRADRLTNSNDDAFILTNNNVIRFQGEAVARLLAGADALTPQIMVLCDEHLTGSEKDNVVARLDYWVKAQVRKHLGGLLDIDQAEGLVGIAKGIAFQLKETFGILDRLKVLSDMKSLDTDGRSALRKNGVRFGAYHIFMPFLLKPYPRALALQLWALKNDKDEKGVFELPALLLAGRTSMVRDAEISDEAYRIAGLRAFETRAVRVDILERIADLIRPALMYREGVTEGEKPEGYIKGGFIVTQSMISLAGASHEDFTHILKGLGYKAEKRELPKAEMPAIEEVAAVEGEAVAEQEIVIAEQEVIMTEKEVVVAETTTVDVWRMARNEEERPKKEYVKREFVKNEFNKDKPKFDRSKFVKPKVEGEPEQIAEGTKKPFTKKFGDKPKFENKKFENNKFDKSKYEKPKAEFKPKVEKPIDMNSPFAKLLALKEAMGK